MDENDWMIGPLQPPMALNNKKTKRQKGQKYWPKSRAKSREEINIGINIGQIS